MSVDFASTIDLRQSGVSQLIGSSSILQPNTPSFSAYNITGAIAAGSYIVFPNTLHNIGGGYNTANGLFTAPVAGVYYFQAHFLAENTTAGEDRHSLYKNGGGYCGGIYIRVKTTGFWSMVCGGHVQMAAGDYVGMIRIMGPAATYGSGGYQSFGGYLV